MAKNWFITAKEMNMITISQKTVFHASDASTILVYASAMSLAYKYREEIKSLFKFGK